MQIKIVAAEDPLTSTMLPPLRSSIILAAILLHATQGSLATHIDLPRRSGSLHNLFARSSTSGLDFVNGSYSINITLGGSQYAVMIDTGRWAMDLFICRQRSPTVRSPALIFGSRVP